jgi:hypothetical protein
LLLRAGFVSQLASGKLKLRRGGDSSMVPLEEVITTVREKIAELEAEINKRNPADRDREC